MLKTQNINKLQTLNTDFINHEKEQECTKMKQDQDH